MAALSLASLPNISSAQNQSEGSLPIQPLSLRNVVLPNALKSKISTDDPLWCDRNRDILVAVHKGPEHVSMPLALLTTKGVPKWTIKLSDAPDFKGASLNEYAMSPNGTVYFQANKTVSRTFHRDKEGSINGGSWKLENQDWILKFDRNGKFVSKTSLQMDLGIRGMAAFDSGALIIVGWKQADEKGTQDLPFVGLFGNQGELLKKIELTENLAEVETRFDPLIKEEVGDTKVNRVVVRVADDGNAYLFSGLFHTNVTVISPEGKVLHSVALKMPAGVSELWKQQFSVGRMAAQFVYENNSAMRSVFGVFDLTTGKLMRQYSTDEYGDGLACFNDEAFTLLGRDRLRLQGQK